MATAGGIVGEPANTTCNSDGGAGIVPIPGFVYLMGVLDGCHKIGRSNDPHGRLKGVGVTLPTRIEVVHAIATADSAWLEVVLHAAFRAAHQSGEWFRMGDDDIALFKSMSSASTVHDLPHETLVRYAENCVVRPKPRGFATAGVLPKLAKCKATRDVNFGREVKRLRLAKNITQQALASAAGVSQSFIAQIETGTRIGRTAVLHDRMCEVFGLPLGYFSPQFRPEDPEPTVVEMTEDTTIVGVVVGGEYGERSYKPAKRVRK